MKKVLCGLLVCAAATIQSPSHAESSGREYELDLPRASVRDVLVEFARQTGLQTAFYPGSGSEQAIVVGPLKGHYTADTALSELLTPSGLSFTRENQRTVTVLNSASSWNSRAALSSGRDETTEKPGFVRLVDRRIDVPDYVSGTASRYGVMRIAAQDVATAAAATSTKASADYSQKPKEDATLEEIIVSAQKRDQKLIDVPISISAISGDTLNNNGVTNMQDLSYSVPSMSTAEVGPGRQTITIRGLGGYRGNTSLTGVYLDEMPVSGLQDGFLANYIDLGATDLERVEVLKGPQGTLFGEGSVGGTVRFITKDPDLSEFGGKVSALVYGTSGGDNSMEVNGVLNVPVVTDKFGIRIEAGYQDDGGWIDRVSQVNGPVIKSDINDSQITNARVKGLWRPTDALAIKGLIVIHRADGGGSNIVNVEPRSESKFIVEFSPTAPTGFSDDYDLYNLTATYDWSSVQLLSSTSYADMSSSASFMQRKPLIPAPNPGFQELLIPHYGQDSTSFSQEVRLSSSGNGAWQWTTGAFYRDADLAQIYPAGYNFWRFGSPVVLPGQVSPGQFSFGQNDKQESESWAVFGDTSYQLTPRFEVGAGVRYFEEDRKKSGFVQTAPTVIAAVPFAGSFDDTTYRAYLSYAVAERARIYTSVATGFRSGGFNAASVVAAGGPSTFNPETVTSYELGTKMSLASNRLSLQAALFYSEYTDIQMNSVFQTTNGTPLGFTGNPGEAEIKGFEWELSWAVTERLTLGLNGDVTDAELTKVDPRAVVGVNGPPQFQVGDPIDLVPEYSLGVNVDYSLDWSASTPGYIRLQYNQQGKNTTVLRTLGALEPVTETPVLNFLSASIGANIRGWECELFGRNLLDEDGALRTGGGVDPQSRPISYGVRFTKTF